MNAGETMTTEAVPGSRPGPLRSARWSLPLAYAVAAAVLALGALLFG